MNEFLNLKKEEFSLIDITDYPSEKSVLPPIDCEINPQLNEYGIDGCKRDGFEKTSLTTERDDRCVGLNHMTDHTATLY